MGTHDAGAVRVAKRVLRQRMRDARSALDARVRLAASTSVCHRLMAWLGPPRLPMTVAVFLATADEVCLDPLVEELLRRGVNVVAPRVRGPGEAPFYPLRCWRGGVRTGAFGVRESVDYPGAVACAVTAVQVVLAPGLAFDRGGRRLGYGGGWYDRILGGAALSIGVCFDCQVVDGVPVEEHDQRVAGVVTEGEIIDVDGRLAEWRQAH